MSTMLDSSCSALKKMFILDVKQKIYISGRIMSNVVSASITCMYLEDDPLKEYSAFTIRQLFFTCTDHDQRITIDMIT